MSSPKIDLGSFSSLNKTFYRVCCKINNIYGKDM